MIELLDGPCKGAYLVKRAPVFLRAVLKGMADFSPATDVLDQLDDTPEPTEKVYVYRLEGEASWMHLYARGKGGKSLSGYYASGRYQYLPEVNGEQLRDNEKWLEWVILQIAAAQPGAVVTPDGFITHPALQNKQMSNGG